MKVVLQICISVIKTINKPVEARPMPATIDLVNYVKSPLILACQSESEERVDLFCLFVRSLTAPLRAEETKHQPAGGNWKLNLARRRKVKVRPSTLNIISTILYF